MKKKYTPETPLPRKDIELVEKYVTQLSQVALLSLDGIYQAGNTKGNHAIHNDVLICSYQAGNFLLTLQDKRGNYLKLAVAMPYNDSVVNSLLPEDFDFSRTFFLRYHYCDHPSELISILVHVISNWEDIQTKFVPTTDYSVLWSEFPLPQGIC